ncbi:MAG: rhomboid family intramembrane serine protease, partial [Acidobacteriota bacterium]
LYEVVLPGNDRTAFIFAHGLVPAHFTWLTATSSMFIHENLLHIGSNLWSLWIFGDNVEDQLGHGRYLIFYLLTGYLAGLAEVWASPGSTVPLIGASGAIAGVMGAYFVMFPYSKILVLIPIIFFFNVIEVPAIIFLGFWLLLQLLGGVGRLAQPSATGGIAFWAHLGGFVIGVLLVWVFRRPERRRVEWWGA